MTGTSPLLPPPPPAPAAAAPPPAAAAPPAPPARSRRGTPWYRVALLLPAAASLLLGLDAALLHLDLAAPLTWTRLPDVHGLLLVLGFVGTLVALERAVALGRVWGHLAPAGLAVGSLLLVAPLPRLLPGAVLTAGAAALVAVYLPLWDRQRAVAVLPQALGAVLALGACLLWTRGVDIPHLLPWLAGFLVLTIAGERLELARLAITPRGERAVLACSAGLVAAVPVVLLWPRAGAPLFGLSLAGLAIALAVTDVARRTVRGRGLPRFSAVCLLIGYGWLVAAGGVWVLVGPVVDGAGYDAAVHAVFLGFVISMIMAHAPVILPAVLRRPLPFHPAMYGPLALLHASLVLRLVVGDAHGSEAAWLAGSIGNITAVLSFLLVAAVRSVAAGRASAMLGTEALR